MKKIKAIANISECNANAIVDSWINLHSTMPQPASNAVRVLVSNLQGTWLRYHKDNELGEIIFSYHIPRYGKSIIHYSGAENDLGAGDIGLVTCVPKHAWVVQETEAA